MAESTSSVSSVDALKPAAADPGAGRIAPGNVAQCKPDVQAGANAVNLLLKQFERNPNRLALYVPLMDRNLCVDEESATFDELQQRVISFQTGWKHWHLKPGDRVILHFKPSIDFYAMTISLLASGMVPVFLDTGMSRRKLVAAILDARPRLIVSTRRFLRFFWLIPALWRTRRFAIDGIGVGINSVTALKPRVGADHRLEIHEVEPEHEGLIAFTAGSGGHPKGVKRTHASLCAEHQVFRTLLADRESDMEMSCFPVWVLHNLCCGKSTVIPKVDMGRPSQFNAGTVLEQIVRYNINRISGPPSFLHALAHAIRKSGQTLDRVESIVSSRAEVFSHTLERIREAFPSARLQIVYGTLEAEPISAIDGTELLNEGKQGWGYLVGYPVAGLQVRVAKITGSAVTEQDVSESGCQPEEPGEVLVSGPHVARSYISPVQDSSAIILQSNGTVWHRTGDSGYFDHQGRLWLTGQVRDLLRSGDHWVHPLPLEKKLDNLKGINRSALVQVNSRVILVLQVNKPWEDLQIPVEHIFASFPIAPVALCFVDQMPVDEKYNAKIDRPLLIDQIEKGVIPISGEI
jgi:acyl-CoA synthetase (AMP-forming)/AMP-acid ligase II